MQEDLFEEELTRSWLDDLLTRSRLYTTSAQYSALLDFVVRLPNFAPFNAMLLQIQKPGLLYAASERDWRELERTVRVGARPLLILWPFAPVALVYDVADTDGPELPEDVAAAFSARGRVDDRAVEGFRERLERDGIRWHWVDHGDGHGGSIRKTISGTGPDAEAQYAILVNRNHTPAVQFDTVAHELAHLYLGHLGIDPRRKVPDRRALTHAQMEVEAESVAYIVCRRNSVEPNSERYLSGYLEDGEADGSLDVYRVMRAAGEVETVLGLATRCRWDRPPGLGRRRKRKAPGVAGEA